MSQKKV